MKVPVPPRIAVEVSTAVLKLTPNSARADGASPIRSSSREMDRRIVVTLFIDLAFHLLTRRPAPNHARFFRRCRRFSVAVVGPVSTADRAVAPTTAL